MAAETPVARFLRHHAEDDPGLVGEALERRGFVVDVVDVGDSSKRIELDDVDVLGILGSKWSVYDEAAVGRWIELELDAIREADRRGIPVLGICFGAQALCTAMGGTVERATTPELGWIPLDGAPDDGIPAGPWFQFHADRCLPPATASVLVRNDACVQVFRIGRHLGVQFHPELDEAQFGRWLEHGAEEAAASVGRSGTELLEEIREREDEVRARVDDLVGAFLALK